MDTKKILSKMTIEEKALLVSGKDFWHTQELERLHIPSMMMTDGPHGLRKQGVKGDHLGIGKSIPATCFPTADTLACSFDEGLLEKVGEALGEECRKEDVAVLLGPAMNIKRNPLCGRNFEYFSEDPYLTGRMAAAYVKGIQSRGVGTSLKHFAANSQEKRRNWQNSVVDERALREIYLQAFEMVVKEAKPWTIMTAYNRLNGTFCSENRWLMKETARREWGFDGLFVTDWGAMSDSVSSFQNGLNLEMPGTCKGTDRELLEAIANGRMTEKELDEVVIKVLELAGKYEDGRKQPYRCDMEAHLILAGRAACESAVLLKNNGVLPFTKDKLLVIGELAREPRYQGAGSSKVNPVKLDSFLEALKEAGVTYGFAPGYDKASGEPDDKLIAEAVKMAGEYEQVVLFIGLTENYESEGYDRENMNLPKAHDRLAEAVCAVNPNTVIVLQCGSPVLLPWRERAGAILLTYLSGCQGGKAALKLLMGEVNPSGKLAETWPLQYEDCPNADTFGTEAEHIEYRESIYVGYRFYDAMEREVAYPFGHGLSYTDFAYSDLLIDGRKLSAMVKNIGSVDGAEVVQLYIGKPDSDIYRASFELKAWQKIFLRAGESKRVSFTLSDRSFSVYVDGWKLENGKYIAALGSSSRDIRLKGELSVTDREKLPLISYPAKKFTKQDFEKLLGRKVPDAAPLKPFTINTLLGQTTDTFLGKLILKFAVPAAAKEMGGDEQAKKMAEAMMKDMPIRAMGMGGGRRGTMYGLTDILNGHLFRGLKKIIRG